jgi:hypothetical protein
VEGALVEVGFSGTGGGPYERRRAGPTGADGRFAFPDLPARRTSLHLRARLGALAAEVDLADAPGALDVDLRLPSSATIAGMILAAEDGRPLAGMEVLLGDRSAKTDPLGRFALLDVPPALLEGEGAVLVVRGAGRRERRHPLGPHGTLDDLLLRVDREPGR